MSAWGVSFGSAWGVSWGSIGQVDAPVRGGGAYRRNWLHERKKKKEQQEAEVEAIFRAISPVRVQATKLFRKTIKLSPYELPSVEVFLQKHEDLTRKRRAQEELELKELLEII